MKANDVGAFYYDYLVPLAPLLVLALYFSKKSRIRKPLRQLILDLQCLFMNRLLGQFIMLVPIVFCLGVFYENRLLTMERNLLSYGLLLVMADFAFFIKHYLEHQHSFLWSTHIVHHTTERLDYSAAFRISFFVGTFYWLFLIPICWIGFSPYEAILGYNLVRFYQLWLHREGHWKLRWISWIVNTPSNHRVHHSPDPAHYNKNLGGILMIWDHLFRTYHPENRTIDQFGLNHSYSYRNWRELNFSPVLSWWKSRKNKANGPTYSA